MTPETRAILTVGHSNLSYAGFLDLLRGSGVTAVADVRSAPYSRYSPQFDRETLRDSLRQDDVPYAFLGDALGGRPQDSGLFRDGVADYEKMAATASFAEGLGRVVAGAGRHRIVLMCSEQDPLDCHRCLLVGRALTQRQVCVRHILADGSQVDHAKIEGKLVAMSKDVNYDLFAAEDGDRLATAYRSRARSVAYGARPAGRPAAAS